MRDTLYKFGHSPRPRLPEWARKSHTHFESLNQLKSGLRQLNLHTVCESARCPNIHECFHRGAATALGIVITCGWIGLAVSSPIIGALAENQIYRRGLMLLPFFSMVMVLLNFVLRPALKQPVTA